jgi:hypothetical protein
MQQQQQQQHCSKLMVINTADITSCSGGHAEAILNTGTYQFLSGTLSMQIHRAISIMEIRVQS